MKKTEIEKRCERIGSVGAIDRERWLRKLCGDRSVSDQHFRIAFMLSRHAHDDLLLRFAMGIKGKLTYEQGLMDARAGRDGPLDD
jgi:hypothetical protein